MLQYAMWATGTNQTDVFFSDPTAIKLYQNHIAKIITRVNTYTGIKYSDEPAIFAWDLINEPRSTAGSACGTACSQMISVCPSTWLPLWCCLHPAMATVSIWSDHIYLQFFTNCGIICFHVQNLSQRNWLYSCLSQTCVIY